MTQQRRRSGGGLGGTIMAIALIVIAVYLLTNIVSGLWWLLGLIAPILFIATLFIDKSVISNYVQWIFNMVRTKPLNGILAGIGTMVAHPIVIAYLFSKAMLGRKLKQKVEERDGKYVEYEEVEEKVEEEDFLELPEIEKVTPTPTAGKSTKSNNEYDDLFG